MIWFNFNSNFTGCFCFCWRVWKKVGSDENRLKLSQVEAKTLKFKHFELTINQVFLKKIDLTKLFKKKVQSFLCLEKVSSRHCETSPKQFHVKIRKKSLLSILELPQFVLRLCGYLRCELISLRQISHIKLPPRPQKSTEQFLIIRFKLV